MRDLSSRNLLVFGIVVGAFVLIVAEGMRVISSFGSAQQTVRQEPQPDYSAISRGRFKKVTIKRQDDEGCIEIATDGTVRVFAECGGEVSEGHRVGDTRFINRLFQILGDGDLSKLPTSGKGPYIDVVIETADGTQTIRIYTGGGGGGDQKLVDDIKKGIDDIINQLPTPTPSPGPVTPTPTLEPGVPTYTPTPTINPVATPTTALNSKEIPFSCGLTDQQGNKRPYNISSIICSTEPTPRR